MSLVCLSEASWLLCFGFSFSCCVLISVSVVVSWFQFLAAATVDHKDPVAAESDLLGLQAATLGGALRVEGSQESLIALFSERGRWSAPSTGEGGEAYPIATSVQVVVHV